MDGLCPAELSPITAKNSAFARDLTAHLQGIVNSANDELKMIKRTGMPEFARQGAEDRVIKDARARCASPPLCAM